MKAVLFDFDGTLADTLPICFCSFQKVFETFDNRKLTSLQVEELFGPSEVGIIHQHLLHPAKEDAIELFYNTYSEYHHEFVNENKEITDLLKLLKSLHIKIGIFTGKGRRSLDISLEALKMDGLFDVIVTGDDVVKPKPDPEGLIKALSLLRVNKADAVFIGDSDADIIAGKQAGVTTIGVNWLTGKQSYSFTEPPHLIANNLEELNNLLKVNAL
ncbi:HAD family hydrolase [Sporosarcina sp. Te-1]|uniref:HAD family hydrolase n=1 Tax=Sporosarcina sp. Te-1 TaxID=2818390 RepID=UPI001A9DB168|nr:HAD family hydrolase [Sporosarcina sp. Te-1]QTD42530.1 HAD family hydrolase [Sporosarcina sp. Te-1]